MGGSSSGNLSKETKRYAPYIENAQYRFFAVMASNRDVALAANPYDGYAFDYADSSFFSIGYVMANFPSLYETFGKFMAGMDIDYLWHKAVDAILTPDEIKQSIDEKAVALDQKILTETLPKYQHEMRDLNAVNTSTYCIGKSAIEDGRVKELGKISMEATAGLLPSLEKNWLETLNFNTDVVKRYALIMKGYFTSRITSDEGFYHNSVEEVLWPFRVLEHERKGLFALAPNTKVAAQQQAGFMQSPAGKWVSVVSWALTGAQIGSEIYPGWGTLIGAVVGAVLGIGMNFGTTDGQLWLLAFSPSAWTMSTEPQF